MAAGSTTSRSSTRLSAENGFIIPSLIVEYMDDKYTDYYFQVTEPEARPDRPVYDPGAAMNIRAQLRVGYRVWDKWLLTFQAAYEVLDEEITQSPIVDKNGTWSGLIGLAYNADVFQPREFDAGIGPIPRLAIRAGIYQNHVSTTVRLEGPDGILGPPYEPSIGSGSDEDGTAYQLDAVLRIGHYHRLEFGRFDFKRTYQRTLEEPVQFGDTTFAAATNVQLKTGLEITRIGYSYSLMHDAQKELAVMAGIHNAKIATELFSSDTGQVERARASTPLPVIGASGSITLGQKTRLGLRLNLFALDFDTFDGNMTAIDAAVEHRVWDWFSMGIGYNYYRLKLSSDSEELAGQITTTQHGPFLFMGVHF